MLCDYIAFQRIHSRLEPVHVEPFAACVLIYTKRRNNMAVDIYFDAHFFNFLTCDTLIAERYINQQFWSVPWDIGKRKPTARYHENCIFRTFQVCYRSASTW